MSRLKKDNMKKCFSLLREFIDEAPQGGKKGSAVLALDQLQRITAGGGTPVPTCTGRPRAEVTLAEGGW